MSDSWYNYVRPVDPHRLATLRWGTVVDTWFAASSLSEEELDAQEAAQVAHQATLAQLVEYLTPAEQDLLDLVSRGCLQSDIGKIFGISQAGVSYQISRVHERLRFLLSWEGTTLSESDVREALHLLEFQIGPRSKWSTIEILVAFLKTLSLREIERRIVTGPQSTIVRRVHDAVAALNTLRAQGALTPLQVRVADALQVGVANLGILEPPQGSVFGRRPAKIRSKKGPQPKAKPK